MVSHIFLNSQMTSSQTALVSPVSRLKVPTSQLPAPRPQPNSKRPWESRSHMAARSASRTGWLVIGLSGQMPDPMWICSVNG